MAPADTASPPTPTGWPSNWTDLDGIAADPLGRLVELHQLIDDNVDPVIVELCRLRIAMLLGSSGHLALRRPKATAAGLTETKIAALADWPRSPLYSDAERACIGLAEQFCMGAFTVSDADVSGVLAHLSTDECYSLVNGLWATEALQRMSIVMGVDPDPEALGLVPAPPSAQP